MFICYYGNSEHIAINMWFYILLKKATGQNWGNNMALWCKLKMMRVHRVRDLQLECRKYGRKSAMAADACLTSPRQLAEKVSTGLFWVSSWCGARRLHRAPFQKAYLLACGLCCRVGSGGHGASAVLELSVHLCVAPVLWRPGRLQQLWYRRQMMMMISARVMR